MRPQQVVMRLSCTLIMLLCVMRSESTMHKSFDTGSMLKLISQTHMEITPAKTIRLWWMSREGCKSDSSFWIQSTAVFRCGPLRVHSTGHVVLVTSLGPRVRAWMTAQGWWRIDVPPHSLSSDQFQFEKHIMGVVLCDLDWKQLSISITCPRRASNKQLRFTVWTKVSPVVRLVFCLGVCLWLEPSCSLFFFTWTSQSGSVWSTMMLSTQLRCCGCGKRRCPLRVSSWIASIISWDPKNSRYFLFSSSCTLSCKSVQL